MDIRKFAEVPTVIPLLRGRTSSPNSKVLLNIFDKVRTDAAWPWGRSDTPPKLSTENRGVP